MTAYTPESLRAIANQMRDLCDEWIRADIEATNAPKSERDDARGVADEAEDRVLAFVSELLAARGGGA